MKKKFVKVMCLGALTLSTMTYVGCTDYDDDIADLQEQINAQKASLSEIQALLDQGAIIKGVEQDAKGVKLTLSNGKEYVVTNGKDGKDGVNGTNGKDGKSDVWTISEDGFWKKNGEYFLINGEKAKAIGVDGATGPQGPQGKPGEAGPQGEAGKPGEDGKNGQYYVPNKETGKFDIYQDGKLVKETEIDWRGITTGITAVMVGNELQLSGVEGAEGVVTLTTGKTLASVAFIPEVYQYIPSLPTTTKKFYHVNKYADPAQVRSDGTLKVLDLNKSNIVEVNYRLNPSDAYLGEKTPIAYINRTPKVTSRALAADAQNLLNNAGYEIKDGILTGKVTVNAQNLMRGYDSEGTTVNTAAIQLWPGQSAYTSDYIYINSEEIVPLIANRNKTEAGQNAVVFYPRVKEDRIAAITEEIKENDAFIKQFVALGATKNVEMQYNKSLNLNEIVGLYTNEKKDYLESLGFEGISFKFSLPKEYKATDAQKTNQQWFVELEEGVLKANAKNLVNGLTPAIGRTPVVRVDAFMLDNAGVERLIASSYIKVDIVKEPTTPTPDPEELAPYVDTIGATKEFEYHALKDADHATTISEMPWTNINNILYGRSDLSAETFWNEFGGTNDEFDVKLTVTNKSGLEEELYNQTHRAGATTSANIDGVKATILLNNGPQTTSNIKISVYNTVKTENTYKDVDGKGAHYTMTITINADNKYARKGFVLKQEFFVREDCKSFEYNPLYYFNTFVGENGYSMDNAIVVKGQLSTTNTWEMSTVISEHFKKIEGKDIFNYFSTINNVNTLVFNWAEGVDGVSPVGAQNADFTVKLVDPMFERYDSKNMTYKTTLVNGEACNFNYNIVFINPFKAGKDANVDVNGNEVGTVTADLSKKVLVVDDKNATIYDHSGLSSKAKNDYKVAAPTVAYAFDAENADYKTITEQMSNASKLEVDPATGKFTWMNQGSTLTKDYKLPVIVTVTFDGLSVVKQTIYVTLKK